VVDRWLPSPSTAGAKVTLPLVAVNVRTGA
jgi:hypothetical protein